MIRALFQSRRSDGFRAVAVLAAALSLWVASAAVAAAQAADPAGVFRQFLDAETRGDTAAQLALVADDVAWSDDLPGTGCAPCVGKDALRRELERRRALSSAQISVVGQQTAGNTATVRFEVRAAMMRQAGIERVVREATVEVRDGRISSVRAALDRNDAQTAAFVAFVQARATTTPTQLPRTGSPAAVPVVVAFGLALALAGKALRRTAG